MKKCSTLNCLFVWVFILSILLVAGESFVLAQEHVAWKLDGAQERIESRRMGACSLHLVLPDGQPVPQKTSYNLDQIRHAFHFGGSLAADWLVSRQEWHPEFKERFARLFNYATINFYWSVHEKTPGQWCYNPDSREKLAWARAQGMTLRGHPLMWHEVVPDWITDTERPVEEIGRDAMEHIRMLVESYPEIDQWDTYNEAPGIYLCDEQQGVRRWVESLGGPGPVSRSVINEARKVRPDGYYILNHYSDADPIYQKLIEYCLEKDVGVDAIGIQTHMHTLTDTFSEERLWRMLQTYSKYKLPIHLSEISILSCERFKDWESLKAWKSGVDEAKRKVAKPPVLPSTPELERYQAHLARDFYTLAFSHPSVEAIVWWSITDLQPWRGMPAGLLDADGNPKPVYTELDRLINGEWKTRITGKTVREGRVDFKGFYGSYEVHVELGGETLVGTFDLARGTNGVRKVVLNERKQARKSEL
ncbi:MAG: endo-1,4-beta-xylanase [Planctomycetes bacterium]|nr:endo-1,4-beta-xylanase [Planctomycetota bacterium]